MFGRTGFKKNSWKKIIAKIYKKSGKRREQLLPTWWSDMADIWKSKLKRYFYK